MAASGLSATMRFGASVGTPAPSEVVSRNGSAVSASLSGGAEPTVLPRGEASLATRFGSGGIMYGGIASGTVVNNRANRSHPGSGHSRQGKRRRLRMYALAPPPMVPRERKPDHRCHGRIADAAMDISHLGR